MLVVTAVAKVMAAEVVSDRSDDVDSVDVGDGDVK